MHGLRVVASRGVIAIRRGPAQLEPQTSTIFEKERPIAIRRGPAELEMGRGVAGWVAVTGPNPASR